MSDGGSAGGGPPDGLEEVEATAAAVDDLEAAADRDTGDGPAADDVVGAAHPAGGRDPAAEVSAEAAGYCAYTDYEWGEAIEDLPATGEDATGVAATVWDRLYEVEDPEMPVSIVDLGLIYGVNVEDGHATVVMTLTYTGCPARNMLLSEVESAAASAHGVDEADVELVWSPEWNLEMVTEAGREDLHEFGVSV